MKATEIRQSVIKRLTPAVGEREARAMAAVILETRCNLRPVDIAVNPDKTLTDTTIYDIDQIVSRIVKGEPLQYILGEAPFHGLTIAVTPGVLIPRPETSELVDIIVDQADGKADLHVLDVCTGSGCIAVALARALKFPEVTAVDIEDIAITTTRLNATRLNVNVTTVKRDVLKEPLPEGKFDIIVSNPPYIDESEKSEMDARVLDHEPAIALFVPDNDPLLFYRAIGQSALDRLNPAGALYFEINPRHVSDLKKMLSDMGYSDVEARRDFNGQYRFIIARR